MIADMIRNDLPDLRREFHRRCRPSRSRYPTVWQMTSTVNGDTAAALPISSSVRIGHGRTKSQTMKIIRELESDRRRLLRRGGLVAPGRQARFNVAIRTALPAEPASQLPRWQRHHLGFDRRGV